MNETPKADATKVDASATRNGHTVVFAKTETERAKEGADKVMYYTFDITKLATTEVIPPLGDKATDADKATRQAKVDSARSAYRLAILKASMELLGDDSDGNCIAIDYLQSKVDGSLLAIQKEKGKDTLNPTVKLERAKDWLANLSVSRAVKRSPMDISLDTMKAEIATASANKALSETERNSAILAATMAHQGRIMAIITQQTADAMSTLGVTLPS